MFNISELSKEEKIAERKWARSIPIDEYEQMVSWASAETYDGCVVEPDGKCSHGYSSPLLIMGWI